MKKTFLVALLSLASLPIFPQEAFTMNCEWNVGVLMCREGSRVVVKCRWRKGTRNRQELVCRDERTGATWVEDTRG